MGGGFLCFIFLFSFYFYTWLVYAIRCGAYGASLWVYEYIDITGINTFATAILLLQESTFIRKYLDQKGEIRFAQ